MGGRLDFHAKSAGRDRVFFPSATNAGPRESLIVVEVLFREKHQYFPRKIALMTSLWTRKMCTISAGIVGVFEWTGNAAI